MYRRTLPPLLAVLTLGPHLGACSPGRETSAGSATSGSGPGEASSSGGEGSSDGDDPSATGEATGNGEDATGDGDADTGAASSTGGGIRFDIGDSGDTQGSGGDGGACVGADCGCNAVDILFVVDNSGSMGIHRAAVNAAFDDMVDAMVNVLPPDTDLHVGLTRGSGFFNPGNAGGWQTCDEFITDGVWTPPDAANHGENGHQGRLYEHRGQTYGSLKTGQDSAAFREWFGGALEGTIYGLVNHSNTETVVAGAAYPFHPANAAANAGFMRQQAVLVLFLLSDSPDLSPTTVDTNDLIAMVSDAKSECGDMCIITSGAIAGACYEPGAYSNTRLFDFMNGFGSPPATLVDLNAGTPDFGAVLGNALADVIATTCESIPPVG